MSESNKKELKIFRPLNIYLGMAIGLISTFYLLFTHTKLSPTEIIQSLSHPSWLWIGMAFVSLFVRDLFYVIRIKFLTNDKLSWTGSLYTIMLWEFASCVTPSVVGGTAVAVFILKKEGIKTGKSIAIVIITAILDNLFFILAAPVFVLLNPDPIKISTFFYVSYFLIASYTLFMAFGVLINPSFFKQTISYVGRILPKKWNNSIENLSLDVHTASTEIKNQTIYYWITPTICTLLVWLSRYFIVNCIVSTYQETSLNEHFSILAKHIVLWITQLVSPTPGGSGFAEVFFVKIIGLDISKATLWRAFTYYLYLLIGVIVLPKWLKRVFS